MTDLPQTLGQIAHTAFWKGHSFWPNGQSPDWEAAALAVLAAIKDQGDQPADRRLIDEQADKLIDDALMADGVKEKS